MAFSLKSTGSATAGLLAALTLGEGGLAVEGKGREYSRSEDRENSPRRAFLSQLRHLWRRTDAGDLGRASLPLLDRRPIPESFRNRTMLDDIQPQFLVLGNIRDKNTAAEEA